MSIRDRRTRKMRGLYRQIVFLVPVLLLFSCLAQGEPVHFTRHGNSVEVVIGGKGFTTYTFDPKISKAFLEPLRDAKGTVVTRTLAVGNEVPPGHEQDRGFEPHQRAMYFGHGDINGNTYWIEEAFDKYYTEPVALKYGRMVFRKIDEMKGGPNSGVIRATFDLLGADGKPIAVETQEFRFSGDADSRVIDCEFVIKAGKKELKFGDTKEGTFAIRLSPQLDSPMGTMVNSEGGEGEPQIWGKRANWVNVDGVVDGDHLGVAIFESPESFRHPTYWHARGYGLLAANPFGLSYFYADPKQDGSYTLSAGQTIHFGYRVLIHEGSYKDAQIAEKYGEYIAHSEWRRTN